MTALQLLVTNCWMDSVKWLAEAREVPLQGLVIEARHKSVDTRLEPFRVTLRKLQDQQQRAWEGAGGH